LDRTRIFVSFDSGSDSDLLGQLRTQSKKKGAQFEISSQTRPGEISDTWTEESRRDITAVDEVVVICNEHTKESVRTATELKIAQDSGVPYLLLWARRGMMCTKPIGATQLDGMYSWGAETVELQIQDVRRKFEAKNA